MGASLGPHRSVNECETQRRSCSRPLEHPIRSFEFAKPGHSSDMRLCTPTGYRGLRCHRANPLPHLDPYSASCRPGRTKRSPEETAQNHRARLMGAMMHAVEQHGYPGTTLQELVTLAGVSNTTFYQQFDSIPDCFLATFDEIVAQASERIEGAYRSKSDFRERLHAAFEELMDICVEEPAATHLVLIDSLSLGAAGVARRQRMSETFELMFRQSFGQVPERGEVSDPTIRAIVGGIRGIVQRRMRSGEVEQLRDDIDELLDWGMSYQRPGGASGLALPDAQPMPSASKAGEQAADEEVWDERPDSIRSRATLTQRERIVRAAAMVVAERGYSKLSIPAITGAAGVSNQTFYEHFSSAHEAFLEALDVLGRRAAASVVAAIEAQEGWVDAIIAGLASAVGAPRRKPADRPAPLHRGDRGGVGGAGSRLAARRQPDRPVRFPRRTRRGGPPLPDVVVEAISGGMYAVIQYEVAEGRTEALPELLPEIAFVALAPFGIE